MAAASSCLHVFTDVAELKRGYQPSADPLGNRLHVFTDVAELKPLPDPRGRVAVDSVSTSSPTWPN